MVGGVRGAVREAGGAPAGVHPARAMGEAVQAGPLAVELRQHVVEVPGDPLLVAPPDLVRHQPRGLEEPGPRLGHEEGDLGKVPGAAPLGAFRDGRPGCPLRAPQGARLRHDDHPALGAVRGVEAGEHEVEAADDVLEGDPVGLAARRRVLVHDGGEEHRVPGHEEGLVAGVEEAPALGRVDPRVGLGEPAGAAGAKARRVDGDLLLLVGEEAGDGLGEVPLQPVGGPFEHRDPADHHPFRGGMGSRFVQIEQIHGGFRIPIPHLPAGAAPRPRRAFTAARRRSSRPNGKTRPAARQARGGPELRGPAGRVRIIHEPSGLSTAPGGRRAAPARLRGMRRRAGCKPARARRS